MEELADAWKASGHGDKRVEDEQWGEFVGLRSSVRARGRDDAARGVKQPLIDEAAALSDCSNWTRQPR
jgi:hypothetical protein